MTPQTSAMHAEYCRLTGCEYRVIKIVNRVVETLSIDIML